MKTTNEMPTDERSTFKAFRTRRSNEASALKSRPPKTKVKGSDTSTPRAIAIPAASLGESLVRTAATSWTEQAHAGGDVLAELGNQVQGNVDQANILAAGGQGAQPSEKEHRQPVQEPQSGRAAP